MASHSLSTVDKEAILKMAGVLIRTGLTNMGDVCYDAISNGYTLVPVHKTKVDAINAAYTSLIKGELTWLN